MSTMPAAGTPAPDFTATAHDGTTITLSSLKGGRVVLYFYPKDDTPGCTKQACNLRDNHSDLQARGITVIGVSADDNASHQQFADKHNLPFPLIPDPEHEILSLYGVWGERNLYGNKFMGIKRSTFLIDEDGEIVHVFKRPKVVDHAAEILKKFGLG